MIRAVLKRCEEQWLSAGFRSRFQTAVVETPTRRYNVDNKKKWAPRFLSPAALSLLFGAAFAGDVSAMEPAVDDSIRLDSAVAIADTQNQNQNQNQNSGMMAATGKPLSLRQIDSQIS
jgi:hypothetical protein